MKFRFTVLVLVTLGFSVADAHHSNAASYINEPKTIEGYVDKYLFRNPHVIVYTNVKDAETGEITRWMSEGPAATGLRLAGWDEDTLAEGDYIRISGKAGRNDRPMVSLSSVTRLDAQTGAVISDVNLRRRVIEPDDPISPDFSYPETTEGGFPRLTGIWTQGGEFDPEPSFLLNEDPVFTPAGQAIQDTILAINDPQYVKCELAGLIRQAGFTPHPVRIAQYDDRVTFEYEEYAGKRVVYLDDREYEDFDVNERYRLGRYTAYYDGESLVIESDLLRSAWSGIFGQVTSDETSVVETYTRGFDDKWGPYVHMSMIVNDPVNLAEPWGLFWDKYYTVKRFTGTERDNVQLDYKMVPVECQIPLTAQQ